MSETPYLPTLADALACIKIHSQELDRLAVIVERQSAEIEELQEQVSKHGRVA
jgi:hypothetical protein